MNVDGHCRIKALDEICSFVGEGGKILEVAAGLGLWSSAMKFRNLDVKTTGLMTTNFHPSDKEEIWTEIEIIDAIEAIKKYPEYNCLFLSWGRNLLDKIMEEFKGNKLIIVGEYCPDFGGCTDMLRAFSEEDLNSVHFDENEREILKTDRGFKFVKCLNVKGKYNYHDKICFYERCDY